ncbi:C2H2-type zinc finger protein [Halobium salinum]|uniref:C2H2-type zinc finger protein n=1 Tax=Halobium salinum TaxID=1364940 RepID=A0ABD5P725_9EURY|nr:DNA-binding protein [Halobium salinum]
MSRSESVRRDDAWSPHDADGDEPTVDVPSDATPHVCEHCGQPFPEERHLVLHRGLEHYGRLDEAEREAFAEAYESEGAEIRRFRLLALGALVLLYFGFLFMYAVFA